MKRSILFVLTLASGLALGAAAQTPAAPAAQAVPAKVAVIAFQAAVGQTNEFQRNFADLQKKYEPSATSSRPWPMRLTALRSSCRCRATS